MTRLTGDHGGIFLVKYDTADGASDFIHNSREVTDWRVVDDEVRVFFSLNHFTSKQQFIYKVINWVKDLNSKLWQFLFAYNLSAQNMYSYFLSSNTYYIFKINYKISFDFV